MNELNNFTRLFKRVKSNKDLSAQEKLILSEIISYQLHGQPFKLKDATLSIELGMGSGAISKYVNRLYKRGIIDKSTVPFFSPTGGKPKRLRTIKVKNIEQWTSLKTDTKIVEEQPQLAILNEKPIAESRGLKPEQRQDSETNAQTLPTNNFPILQEELTTNDGTFIRAILSEYSERNKELEYQTVNIKFTDGDFLLMEVLQVAKQDKTICYIPKCTIELIRERGWLKENERGE